MLIDCDGCTVRGQACGSCVVTLLLEAPPAIHLLGDAEAEAIEVFALAGFEVTVLDPTHDDSMSERPTPTQRRPGHWHAA
jgi:hypothetical protein